ncbi:MAG: type IV secretion system DNA-binding domain-containing protein [Bacteroidota bacterium]
MLTLEDVQKLTYSTAALPAENEPDTLEIGHTIPAEFWQTVTEVMEKHVASIDAKLAAYHSDMPLRWQLLSVRGFTYPEFLVLFNKKVSVEQADPHPIFEVLMMATEEQRKHFTSKYNADETSYLKALYDVHAPIATWFFSPLPARLRVGDLIKHCYISGQSGSGKSEMMKQLWYHLQAISAKDRKYALLMLDPHGDLAREVAGLHLNEDFERLVYIDPYLDATRFPVLNPLDLNDRTLTTIDIYAQSLARVFQELWPSAELTLQMQTLLIPCIATLLYDGNRTLKDLQAFMQNDAKLIELGRQSPFPAHREFFQNAFGDKSYSSTKSGIYTRIQSLLNNDGFYRLTCGKSTIDLEQAIDAGKVIIIRFTKNKGEEANRAFNKMIIALLQSIVLKRADITKGQRKPLFLFIDEFQNFLSPSIGTIMEESRKFGLHMIIANQNLGQIDDSKLLRTVLGNSETKIVGANGHKDLKDLSAEINVPLKQMQHLPKYHFYIKSGNNTAYVIEPKSFLLEQKPPFYLPKEKAAALREWIIEVSGQYKSPGDVPPTNTAQNEQGTPPVLPTETGRGKLTPKFKI